MAKPQRPVILDQILMQADGRIRVEIVRPSDVKGEHDRNYLDFNNHAEMVDFLVVLNNAATYVKNSGFPPFPPPTP